MQLSTDSSEQKTECKSKHSFLFAKRLSTVRETAAVGPNIWPFIRFYSSMFFVAQLFVITEILEVLRLESI
jgi:hypothetical protein